MEFMGRHNLVLCINITWMKNNEDIYTWVNNIFITNVIWFHSNTISNILWWKPNICIRKFIHPYVSVIFCYWFKSLWFYVFPIVVYALLLSNLYIIFLKINWFCFMHVICCIPCGMVTFENMFIIKERNKQ